MFDISTQAVQDTATIHIKNAAGEPLYADPDRTKPVQIVIYGPGSKAFGAVEARQSARALKRMQDNDGKITAATSEERIKETAEDLAAITVRFENFVYPPAGEATGLSASQWPHGSRRNTATGRRNRSPSKTRLTTLCPSTRRKGK